LQLSTSNFGAGGFDFMNLHSPIDVYGIEPLMPREYCANVPLELTEAKQAVNSPTRRSCVFMTRASDGLTLTDQVS
jgi:hypothetical protein